VSASAEVFVLFEEGIRVVGTNPEPSFKLFPARVYTYITPGKH